MEEILSFLRAINLITKRIKWLLQGSKRIFGMVKGDRLGMLIDCSDSNFGFGRQTAYLEALVVSIITGGRKSYNLPIRSYSYAENETQFNNSHMRDITSLVFIHVKL